MLLPSFEYARPTTVEGAISSLSASRNARVLAGGQTLLNALKLRLVKPEMLVDITGIEALHAIELRPDGSVLIGAATTYDEIVASSVLRERHPVTAAMTARLVDRQVRARGTIGGNVCLADPTSNFPPLLVALGARLAVDGPAGPREVDAEDFFVAPYMTALDAQELLVAVVLPALGDEEGVGYESLQVGTDSWALARACALVRCAGEISEARVALGCGAIPVRQPLMERALIGAAPTAEAIADAALQAGEGFDPPDDVHASAEYRTEMARLMAARAVASAVGERA